MSDLRNGVDTGNRLSRLDYALTADTYNNNLDDYLRVLGLQSSDDLKGLVLDIGPGDAELFSREMALLGRSVVSVNPQLVFPRSAEMAIGGFAYVQRGPFMMTEESRLPWQRKSVAGLAQELPFGDNTFGSIVSLGAIPAYLPPRRLRCFNRRDGSSSRPRWASSPFSYSRHRRFTALRGCIY